MKRLFNSNNKFLNELVSKSHEAQQLTELLKRFLEPDLAAQCKVINFEKGCLTVAVASAIWATKFRYVTADLLSFLRKEGKLYNLRSINSIIEQPHMLQVATPQQSNSATKKNQSSEIIQQAATTVSSELLRKALEKLAVALRK